MPRKETKEKKCFILINNYYYDKKRQRKKSDKKLYYKILLVNVLHSLFAALWWMIITYTLNCKRYISIIYSTMPSKSAQKNKSCYTIQQS